MLKRGVYSHVDTVYNFSATIFSIPLVCAMLTFFQDQHLSIASLQVQPILDAMVLDGENASQQPKKREM